MVPKGLECEGSWGGEPVNVVVDGLRMVTCARGLGEGRAEKNRSRRRTKATRVRRCAAGRESIGKTGGCLERKSDWVWARGSFEYNSRNADLGDPKCNKGRDPSYTVE